jgi:hypothetical protein
LDQSQNNPQIQIQIQTNQTFAIALHVIKNILMNIISSTTKKILTSYLQAMGALTLKGYMNKSLFMLWHNYHGPRFFKPNWLSKYSHFPLKKSPTNKFSIKIFKGCSFVS